MASGPSAGERARIRHRLLFSCLVLFGLPATVFLASAAPAAETATLADSPTTPILDNFNRPNEDPLSQNGA